MSDGNQEKEGTKHIIVSPFMTQANVVPFNNLENIMRSIDSNIKVIALYGENVLIPHNKKNIEIKHRVSQGIIKRTFFYLVDELIISYHIISSKQYKRCIFFMGDIHVIPMFIAKLGRKKTMLVLGGSIEELFVFNRDPFSTISKLLRKINLYLSDIIILYSSKLVNDWELQNYRDKILIASEHIINTDEFRVIKRYKKRKHLIGYIGRLSEEKGVFNFVKAIPLINNKNNALNFIIGGDGKLYQKIETYLSEGNLGYIVKQVGWIPHDKLPKFFNELKLLVLPSYTEGLPNIMLEAMACGTPVLATPVGAIPDVIKDGETGFLLENNSPECIAETALKILHMPDDKLEKVSDNARALVEEKFTFEAAVERWSEIMEGI